MDTKILQTDYNSSFDLILTPVMTLLITLVILIFRNSIGPVLALYSVAETCKPLMSACNIDQMNPPQSWIISIGCAGIVLGLWTLGKRVIKTVGKDIAKITPAR